MTARDRAELVAAVEEVLERRLAAFRLELRAMLAGGKPAAGTEGDPSCPDQPRSESMDPTHIEAAGGSSSPHPVATEMFNRLRAARRPCESKQTSLPLSKGRR